MNRLLSWSAVLALWSGSAVALERHAIAVLKFEDATGLVHAQGGMAREYGRQLQQELGARGAFRMVANGPFGPGIAAPELAGDAEPDAASAIRLGKDTGARYLVVGRLTRYAEQGGTRYKRAYLGGGRNEQVSDGGSLHVALRVIDTRDGSVAWQRDIGAHTEATVTEMALQPTEPGEDDGAPTARAVRAAVIETVDYLECELALRDRCLAEYADPNVPPDAGAR